MTSTDSLAAENAPGSVGSIVRAVRFPLVVMVVWRLIHGVVMIGSGTHPLESAFRFDAGYYLQILREGYVVTDPSLETFQTVAFFPAFPLVAAPFVRLLGETVGGTVVMTILCAAAFVSVYLVTRSYFGEAVARVATITMACWPGSFFLWAFYSESLFVTATAGALLADRSRRHWLSALLIFIAGLTRSVGFFFGPVMFAARWWRIGRPDRVAFGYLVSSVASAATLMLIMQLLTGDPLSFSSAQRAWGRTPSAPWTPTVLLVRDVMSEWPDPPLEALFLLAVAVLFIGLGVWMLGRVARSTERRSAPIEIGVWTVVAAAIPHLTTLLGGIVRFVLSAWTGFVIMALIVEQRPVFRWALWGTTACLSLLLLRRWADGIYVA